ncbi:MAG TPA: P1 family peptidase [Candidatus Polarisedimenticolia bacterium]|nr:P1 family peptidase [Candidatus Polarisedimenticolia bacterium]
MTTRSFFVATALLIIGSVLFAQTESRPRVRDLGVHLGVLPPGPLNAITDVAGVKVGQTTLIRGDNIRTGVTAILPHGRNLYRVRIYLTRPSVKRMMVGRAGVRDEQRILPTGISRL